MQTHVDQMGCMHSLITNESWGTLPGDVTPPLFHVTPPLFHQESLLSLTQVYSLSHTIHILVSLLSISMILSVSLLSVSLLSVSLLSVSLLSVSLLSVSLLSICMLLSVSILVCLYSLSTLCLYHLSTLCLHYSLSLTIVMSPPLLHHQSLCLRVLVSVCETHTPTHSSRMSHGTHHG